MNQLLKELGEKVRQFRTAQGLTQEDLAEKAGLHATYIGGVERGERNLTVLTLEKISRSLDLDLREFFERRKGKRVPGLYEKTSGEIMSLLRREDESTLKLATMVVRDVVRWRK